MTHIALALHDKQGTYWPYIVTTLTSVFANSSIALHVHILHDDTFTPQARQAIEQLCKKYGQQVTTHAMTLTPAMQKANVRHFSIAALYRLMLLQLLRNEDLVIYLHADLIFNGVDIADLVQAIQSDPQQHPIAAVRDDLFTNNTSQRNELDMLGIPEKEYFNSGLLGLRPQRIEIDFFLALHTRSAAHPPIHEKPRALLAANARPSQRRLPHPHQTTQTMKHRDKGLQRQKSSIRRDEIRQVRRCQKWHGRIDLVLRPIPPTQRQQLLYSCLVKSLAHHLGRVAGHDGVRRHIFGHHTLCSQHRTIAHAHARQNRDAMPNPDIAANYHIALARVVVQ